MFGCQFSVGDNLDCIFRVMLSFVVNVVVRRLTSFVASSNVFCAVDESFWFPEGMSGCVVEGYTSMSLSHENKVTIQGSPIPCVAFAPSTSRTYVTPAINTSFQWRFTNLKLSPSLGEVNTFVAFSFDSRVDTAK